MNRKSLALVSSLMAAAIASSADTLQFINITPVVFPSGLNRGLFAVAYGGSSNFVAVGEVGTVVRGLFKPGENFINPDNWVTNTVGGSTNLLAVASSGNNLFVASGSRNVIFTSTDGVAWTTNGPVFPNTATTAGIAYNHGVFATVAMAPEIAWATDPAHWTVANLADLSILESYRGVTAYGATEFAACGVFGIVRSSTDGGTNWHHVFGGIGKPDLLSIAADVAGTTLVSVGDANPSAAGGANGVILVSTNNGTNWASVYTNSGANTPLNAVASTGSGFVAAGNGGQILTSSNGTDWTAVPTTEWWTNATPAPDLQGVVFATSPFMQGVGVLVGKNGTIILAGAIPSAPQSLGDRTNCVGYFTNKLCVSVTSDAILAVDWFTNETRMAGEFPLTGGTNTTCFIPPVNLGNTGVGEHRFWAETRDRRTGFVSTDRTRVSVWVDPEPPNPVSKDIMVDLDANGYVAIQATDVDGGSTDNCAITNLSVSPREFRCTNFGLNTVTLRVTDSAGNFSNRTAIVTVRDKISPIPNCPANITTNNDLGQCSARVQFAATPTDNCGVGSTNYSIGGLPITSPHAFPVGTTTVDVTVTDIHDNSTNCSFTVTVNDTENPTITAPLTVTTTNDVGHCYATGVSLGAPRATNDNCGILSVTNNAPIQFPVGPTVVIWTVWDIHGNSATATQTITVNDVEKPTITAPVAVTTTNDVGRCYATGVALGAPLATNDNCAIQSVTNNAPAQFPVGPTPVTWTVLDNHGNSATAIQTVTVIDMEKPTITAPVTVTTTNDAGRCYATGVSLGGPQATNDNCGILSVTNNAPAQFPVGPTPVIWTVWDIHGNSATATQTVMVNDVEKPTITAPLAVTTTNDVGQCYATGVALGAPLATNDNCAIQSVSNNAPAQFPVGTTPVTWTVLDNHGNSASATQTVMVNDVEKPTITAPVAVTTTNDLGQCYATGVTLGAPQATNDNCRILSVTNNAPAQFPVGPTPVIWTAWDTHGNSATSTQTVTVLDKGPPTIICPANLMLEADAGQCSRSNVSFTVTASDNCTPVTVLTAPMSGTTFPGGTTTVTATATDTNGNAATCSFTVSVYSTNVTAIVNTNPVSVIEGGTATISVALTGTPNWTVTWSDGSISNYASSPGTKSVSSFEIGNGSLGAQTNYYVVSVRDTNCFGRATGSVPVQVISRATVSLVSSNNSICRGECTQLTVVLKQWTNGAIYGSPWTVYWRTDEAYESPIPGTNTLIIESTTTFGISNIIVCPTSNLTYRINRVRGTKVSGNGPGTDEINLQSLDRVDMTVNPLPTAYAVSGTTNICSGSPANITLSGSQNNVTYSLLAGVTSLQTSNGTGSQIIFTVAPTNTTMYTVVATTNTSLCAATMTSNATVTVNTAAVISVQPANLTVCTNSPAILTVVATGAGLTYQWLVSGDGGTSFTNVSGIGTTASYTNAVTTPADNGNQYKVIITGTCGSSVTSTPPALLTVSQPVYKPALTIVRQNTNAVLSWTTSCNNYVLEKMASIAATNWTTDMTPVVISGNQNTVTVPISSTNLFFRLRYP